MTNINPLDIILALEKHLSLMPDGIPIEHTQFANDDFKIPPNDPYQKLNTLRADPLNPEWGNYYQSKGYFQIMLFFPGNKGEGAAIIHAGKIADWFEKGLTLTRGTASVCIDFTPTIAQGAEDGDRYTVPIKVRYTASPTNAT